MDIRGYIVVILIVGASSEVYTSTANNSSPIGTRPKCTLSRDKLTQINNEIHLALSNAETASTLPVSNCQLNSSSNENCNELVQILQCGVSHLIDGFRKAVSCGTSMDEVIKWKTAYETLNEKYNSEIDFIKQATAQNISLIRDELTKLLQEVNKALAIAEANSREKSLRLCISEIASGQIDRAVSEFKNIKNDTKLVEIVRSVYGQYGKLDQVANVVNFVSRLPSCSQDRIAMPALFDIMKENNHLNSPNILILNRAVSQCMSNSPLENELKAYSKGILEGWAYKVRTGNVQQINDFAQDLKSWGSFMYHEKDLIKYAYQASLHKPEVVLSFVRNLPYIQLMVVGLLEVYKQMEASNHLSSSQLLILNYQIKDIMGFGNYPAIGKYYTTQFAGLRPKVTTNVDKLLDTWAGKVRNDNYRDITEFAKNQYRSFESELDRLIGKIYAKSVSNAKPAMVFIRNLDYTEQKIHGLTALYQNMKHYSHLDSAQLLMLAFRIKEVMGLSNYASLSQKEKDIATRLINNFPTSVRNLVWSGMRRCTLKNYHYGEYLYTASNARKYWPYLWVPKSLDKTAYWQLDTRDDGESFYIVNNNLERHLYMGNSEYNHQRHHVQTHTYKHFFGVQTRWQIIPEGDKFLIRNNLYGNYLYGDATKRDKSRRYVFLWKPKQIPPSVKSERKWLISC